ncbi:hypothetical protein BK659_04080 [Pseudomonas brassicacearum]|uniref:Uncharacterized protein n=1 Tax=Pseudomonas brassicacearum TaxID=930166 RepID=A0A423HC53_9PSED|nr:hypothetical protein [Pseudomonas brassicacearum]RON10699.1 hypothetical protein BK659_04080 [Pseudomonas brassicacearum]
MNILDFLEQDFNLSGSGLETAKLIRRETDEDFVYKNEYIIKKTGDAYKKEITTQKEIADTAAMAIPGFEQLINALSEIQPETVISMRFIDSLNWDGRIYFDETKKILGMILGKKKNKNWKTPPNWDGSEEMLRQYNASSSSSQKDD